MLCWWHRWLHRFIPCNTAWLWKWKLTTSNWLKCNVWQRLHTMNLLFTISFHITSFITYILIISVTDVAVAFSVFLYVKEEDDTVMWHGTHLILCLTECHATQPTSMWTQLLNYLQFLSYYSILIVIYIINARCRLSFCTSHMVMAAKKLYNAILIGNKEVHGLH